MAPRKKRSGVGKRVPEIADPKFTPWRKHCFCKQDKSTGWTVECANCTKWYHGVCIELSQQVAERAVKFYCKRCSSLFGLRSEFRPKCRLEGCERPALETSDWCGEEHHSQYWRSIVDAVEKRPEKEGIVLNWLANRCEDNVTAFTSATPNNLPTPPKIQDSEKDLRAQRVEAAIRYRESHNVCGFEASLLNLNENSNYDEEAKCQGGLKSCLQHRNWPDMLRKRLQQMELSEKERCEPDPVWVAKRAKYLVAGTTRFSRRKGWKAAYFIPYVWEDDDRDFFSETIPSHFGTSIFDGYNWRAMLMLFYLFLMMF